MRSGGLARAAVSVNKVFFTTSRLDGWLETSSGHFMKSTAFPGPTRAQQVTVKTLKKKGPIACDDVHSTAHVVFE